MSSARKCMACLLVFAPGPLAAAQKVSWGAQGYVRHLSIRLSSPTANTAYWLNVSRLRLQGLAAAGRRVHAEAWLDTEVRAGSYVRSADYEQARLYGKPDRLTWQVVSRSGAEVRQRLFRGFVLWQTPRATVTAGRQRIAWGSGFAWNPTDLLNPHNPGAIELGERAGVDAVHVGIVLGPLSRLELVGAYHRSGKPLSLASRGGFNYRSYDLTAMAGIFEGDPVLGADFAGYVGGAGVRGEAAYVRRAALADYVRAVLNADYTFARGIYGLVELYFNGQGKARRADYDFRDILSGDTFNLARWYAALSLSTVLTPLVGASLYQLTNLNDGSLLAGPSVVVSLAESVELAAAAYFFIGATGTEYGAQRHAFFVTLQWFF